MVDGTVLERNVLGVPLAQLDREVHPGRLALRYRQQLARRVEAEQEVQLARIERQVQPGADAELEHPAARLAVDIISSRDAR